MSKKYSIAKARDSLASLVHEVEEQGEAVTLTRRGEPVAVLVSLREYRRLREGSGGFWGALRKFRSREDLVGLGLGPEDLDDVRDRSPGREVDLV